MRLVVPVSKAWRINTKDGLKGFDITLGKSGSLSIIGRPRDVPIKTGANPIRIVTNFFFRRVKPAEKPRYALVRNGFAAALIGTLIFSAANALDQAQNEIETRAKSAECSYASQYHSISVLIGHYGQQTAWKIIISTASGTIEGGYFNISSSSNCTGPVLAGETPGVDHMLHLYTCSGAYHDLQSDLPWRQLVYRIDLYPELSGEVLDNEVPLVWLLNKAELPSNYGLEDIAKVPFYQPPLKLLRGMHISAEAKLITRRFIRSPVMKEKAFGSKPEYEPLSLYPITEPIAFPLNSSDSKVAAATIRTTLAPGLMSFRGRQDKHQPLGSLCDFLEDYRTGTIFDFIGSIGGLFALLQSVQIFLFGRPLFWGLNGAKLITPFGFLGEFSSTKFKDRLSDEYHTTEGSVGGIQIEKFLKDFVVDFGPATLGPEPESHSPQPHVVSDPELGAPKDVTADSNEDRVESLPQIRAGDGPAGGEGTNPAAGGTAESTR